MLEKREKMSIFYLFLTQILLFSIVNGYDFKTDPCVNNSIIYLLFKYQPYIELDLFINNERDSERIRQKFASKIHQFEDFTCAKFVYQQIENYNYNFIHIREDIKSLIDYENQYRSVKWPIDHFLIKGRHEPQPLKTTKLFFIHTQVQKFLDYTTTKTRKSSTPKTTTFSRNNRNEIKNPIKTNSNNKDIIIPENLKSNLKAQCEGCIYDCITPKVYRNHGYKELTEQQSDKLKELSNNRNELIGCSLGIDQWFVQNDPASISNVGYQIGLNN
jgi:hypothetical protein